MRTTKEKIELATRMVCAAAVLALVALGMIGFAFVNDPEGMKAIAHEIQDKP